MPEAFARYSSPEPSLVLMIINIAHIDMRLYALKRKGMLNQMFDTQLIIVCIANRFFIVGISASVGGIEKVNK